MKSNPPKDHH